MTPTEFKAALMPNVTATVQNGTAADVLGMVEAMHAAIVGTLIAIKADALSAQLLEASSRYMADIEMVKRREEAQRNMREANKALKLRYPEINP